MTSSQTTKTDEMLRWVRNHRFLSVVVVVGVVVIALGAVTDAIGQITDFVRGIVGERWDAITVFLARVAGNPFFLIFLGAVFGSAVTWWIAGALHMPRSHIAVGGRITGIL